VFSLYEHILASSNPETCEEDVQLLEQTAAAMKEACKIHAEYVPITNTILALNKVCRTTQESRQQRRSASTGANREARGQALADLIHRASPSQTQLPILNADSNLPISLASEDIARPESSLPFPQGLSLDNNEFFSMDAMRALENEFTERNWHETWWDMDGDIDVGLENTPS
jgi:LAS superfamily LD-carboxypeptidase LdcB